MQPSTSRAAERVISPPHHSTSPANYDRQPAIITARRRGKRFGDAPDLTPEEHKLRGDAADALWRELVRRATAKDRP